MPSAMACSCSPKSLQLIFHLLLMASLVSSISCNRVSVGLYYESLCPYSAQFIVDSLSLIFTNGLIDIVDLNLVPWGNAKLLASHEFKCQHGANECLLNIVEACAIDVWPDVNVHFPFVYCVESLVYHHNYTYWETCFEKLGLDASPVADCYQSGHGTELELKYAEETNLLQPPHKYVPWVVVDGQPLCDDYTDVISYICNAYKGSSLPSICEEPSLIKLKINLLSGIPRLKSNLIQSEHRGSNSVFWTRGLRMSRGMIQMVGLILILFLSDSHKVEASLEGNDYKSCEHVVKNWASSSVDLEVRNDKHELRDFLFFLHIPRTGGRAYLHCFLKKLYSNSPECLNSYDKLRFNPGQPNCRLISTHDDYSVISKFPREKTSVVTILRNPLDRVFSTYEFSVEVAARFLIHPNLTSVAQVAEKAFRAFRARRESSVVSTLDIWPWKYLVRWMREDLFARRDARRLRGLPHLITNDSYDMDDMVMPLHEYINDPIAQEIVHNGATFQIAGITNNSYSADAHEVRHCVQKYHTLGEYVLEVAKKRLDEMLYVGLTENHKESATGFANAVGAQVISMHMEPNTITDAAIHNDHGSEIKGKFPNENNETDADDQDHNTNVTSSTGKMTVGKLLESYENCVPSARRLQSQRRVNALKQVSPVNFTKQARKMVSPELLHEIESLNNLDIQLYKYAQSIFAKHQDTIQHDVVTEGLASTLSTNIHPGLYDSLSSNLLFLCIGCLTSVLILVYVKSWRKVSKVKL